VFVIENVPLTYNQALQSFLSYPVAQGTEDLSIINVNGIATFNDSIISNNVITQLGSTNNITQNITTNTTPNILKSSTINGDLTVKPVAGNALIKFYDVGGTNVFSQISQSSTDTKIDCLGNNGSLTVSCKNASTSKNCLVLSTVSGGNIINSKTDNALTVFNVIESNSNKNIGFIPNSNANNLNPIVLAGDNQIICSTTSNSNVLVAGVWSTRCNGIKIDGLNPTTSIGQGGTGGVFTNSFSCSATNSKIIGPAVFTTTTAPTSAQTILATNDSSTKLPTTQWVQSVISTIPPPLFIRAYKSSTGLVPSLMGIININFNGSVVNVNDTFTIRYSIRYDYNTTATTQSIYYLSYYGNMMVFPRRVVTNGGIDSVLLNGSMAGNSTYIYNDATVAPLGRYIWTENYVTTSKIDSLNNIFTPVILTFTDQAAIKFNVNTPYTPPATSSCSLSVSLEIINSCNNNLILSSTNSSFTNVTKNF
jgi:hypothetical protein